MLPRSALVTSSLILAGRCIVAAKNLEFVCCSLAKNFRTAKSEGSKDNALHEDRL